jgi:hypothetical protein
VLAEEVGEAGDLVAQPPELVVMRDGSAQPVRRGADPAGLGEQGGDRAANLALADAEAGQRPGGRIVAHVEQRQQDVLGADVVVAVGHRLAQGPRHDPHGQRDIGMRLLGGLGGLR